MCDHHWVDDTAAWNNPPIQAAVRCSKCRELRIQPIKPVDHVTVRVSLVEDRTEGLQEPLPEVQDG